MPSPVIKSFAKKSKKSIAEVDAIWNETKEEAIKKFKTESPQFWAYVNATVQAKLGISKSFKEFVRK
jgi:hypothetical protein